MKNNINFQVFFFFLYKIPRSSIRISANREFKRALLDYIGEYSEVFDN